MADSKLSEFSSFSGSFDNDDDRLVGVHDNGDGSYTDYRYKASDLSGTLVALGDGVTPTTIVGGPAAGTTPGFSFSTKSDDTGGTITVVAGAGSVAGIIFTFSFNTPYASQPRVVAYPANDNAADIFTYTPAAGLSTFTLRTKTGVTLTGGQQYAWTYIVQPSKP